MFSDLILIHRARNQRVSLRQPTANTVGDKLFSVASDASLDLFATDVEVAIRTHWFFWQTCLRQIALGDEAHFEPAYLRAGDEVYRGDAAYRFLLETICGLHSPLLGETEVYGQFKNAVAAFAIPASPFGSQLKRFFRSLFEDAKEIRNAHLVDLGSQSYGSVLRREIKGLRRIHIIGAGQLVEEIIPWLQKDGTSIRVHCRDTQKASRTLAAFPQVEICALEEERAFDGMEALIIAAPVTAQATAQWMDARAAQKLEFVADLRADSGLDRLVIPTTSAPVLDLDQVFSKISANQALLAKRKAAALEAVEAKVSERGAHVEYRPFGWEDVCA